MAHDAPHGAPVSHLSSSQLRHSGKATVFGAGHYFTLSSETFAIVGSRLVSFLICTAVTTSSSDSGGTFRSDLQIWKEDDNG